MNIRMTALILIVVAVVFVAPARADRVRTGSNYGQILNSQTSSIGTQFLVPLTPIDPAEGDLLLQVSPSSPDLNDPIQVKIALSPTELIANTGTFGIVTCPGFNLGSACTPASNAACDLSGVTYQGGMLTLPGSCNVANETFYFDEGADPNGAFTGTFADISAVKTMATPEPGTLELLALALVSSALLSKRLLQS